MGIVYVVTDFRIVREFLLCNLFTYLLSKREEGKMTEETPE